MQYTWYMLLGVKPVIITLVVLEKVVLDLSWKRMAAAVTFGVLGWSVGANAPQYTVAGPDKTTSKRKADVSKITPTMDIMSGARS
jgi:hypothetical protein